MGVVIFMTTPKEGKAQIIELGLILWVALLTEITSLIIIQIIHDNPNFTGSLYNVVNFPLGVLLYRRYIDWKQKNLVAALLIILFLIFALTNLFLGGLNGLNSYTSALAGAGFIIMSITYFYMLIRELPTESITKLPMFWISTANLIYYSGIFFLDLMADYLISVMNDSLTSYWQIHNFLGLAFYAILWYGMLLLRSHPLKRSTTVTR